MTLLRVAPRVAVLAAVLLIATGCGGGKLRLRVNPEDGATYEITTTMTTASSQTIMGMETQANTETRMVQELSFHRLDDGSGFEVVATYVSTSMNMNIDADGGTVNLSAITSSSPIDDFSAALEGASFTLTMSPTGKVTSVSGIDEMMGEVLDGVDLSDAMKTTLRDSMKQKFGDDAV